MESFDSDEIGRRRSEIAASAGLSSIHGGPSSSLLRYQAQCDMEQGLTLSIDRIWARDKGDAPNDMFIVCPVCGEEHTLVLTT